MDIPAAERGAVAGDTDTVEAAGHFRIYLGAAAGVGNTYAMLNEGRRRRRRGTDVVIGFVECHGRRLTEEMIGDLEVVPRNSVDYRGSHLEEMDLDAVLRRHPKVALVDELAHTNVPGSGRNDKRWQDVTEILAAGIDVVTTVNIQHLESIADEVGHMTGARVRERVPDWVVRKADQIELVDSSPEQLRRRMVHGNINPKARAIARFAQEHQITQIVIGSSQRSRWQQLTGGGSNVTRVIREADPCRRPRASRSARRSRSGSACKPRRREPGAGPRSAAGRRRRFRAAVHPSLITDVGDPRQSDISPISVARKARAI